MALIPYIGRKFLPHQVSNQGRKSKYEFEVAYFKPLDYGAGVRMYLYMHVCIYVGMNVWVYLRKKIICL